MPANSALEGKVESRLNIEPERVMGIERSAGMGRVRNLAEGLRKQFSGELQLNLQFFCFCWFVS